jgi:hypothetical protein
MQNAGPIGESRDLLPIGGRSTTQVFYNLFIPSADGINEMSRPLNELRHVFEETSELNKLKKSSKKVKST